MEILQSICFLKLVRISGRINVAMLVHSTKGEIARVDVKSLIVVPDFGELNN